MAGAWYVNSTEQTYDELHLSLAYTQQVGDLTWYAGVTHLRTPFNGEEDNELSLGVAYSGLPYEVEIAVDTYYSLNAEGSFTEFSIGKSHDLSEALTVSVNSVLGMNQGYVSDGHDGVNHLALGAGLDYAMTEELVLSTHVTWSNALRKESGRAGDEALKDFFHVGAGLGWTF